MLDFNQFLPKLITKKEWQGLHKRFKIITLLQSQLTYREIAHKMGISTTTVVRLNQRLKVRKLKKTKQSRSNFPLLTKSPWMFGKSDES